MPYTHYEPPRLVRGSVWFISFYVINPETGKLKRVRIKINRIRNIKERLEVAKKMIDAISRRLALGWNPLTEKIAPKAATSIDDALDRYLAVKSKETEKQTISSYRSYVKIVREWLSSSGVKGTAPIYIISKEIAQEFFNHLETSDGISARTYNNYLSFLTSLWAWLVEKGYVQDNIFITIRKKPKKLTKKTRRLLTQQELMSLFRFLGDKPEYLSIVLLCYCCLIRPKEIALLRCSDINLEKQLVHIRPEIAKNDNDSFRTIPDEIMPVIRGLDLSSKDWYVFGRHQGDGRNFKAGPDPMFLRKISAYWDRYVRPACGFPPELQFYSLKDTGITTMISEGVPVSFVQQQADHSSVAMTAIYVGKMANKANQELKRVDLLNGNKI